MTIFSFIILGIVLYYLLRKKKILDKYIYITALAIAVETMMSSGYFIRWGNFELGHSETIILLDTVIAATMFLKKKKLGKHLTLGMLLVFSCLLSLLIQMTFPYEELVVSEAANWDMYYFLNVKPGKITIGWGHVKEILHVMCYVIILAQFFYLNQESKDKLLLKVFHLEKPFIWYGLLEVVCVKIMHCQTTLLKCLMMIIGDSWISSKGNISIGVGNRLQGMNSEPSMYSVALFIFILLGLYLYKDNKEKKILVYIFLALGLMISSLALSAIICLIWLVAFCFFIRYQKGNYKTRVFILLIFAASLIAVFASYKYFYSNTFDNYYLQRIHMALINLNDLSIDGWSGDYYTYDGSTKIRLVSMVGTLKYFLDRPLFGLALGSTYSHSSFATILASIGIVGTLIWSVFTFGGQKEKCNRNYILLIVAWYALLFIAGIGLFQFYGVQNITIVSVLSYFRMPINVTGIKKNEKYYKDCLVKIN